MLVKSANLILIAIAITFFSRVLEAVGFPSTINFLHFALIPLTCGAALIKARSRVRIRAAQPILFGLVLMLMLTIASAILNRAGAINVVLDYLLLTEPFILLLGIISLRMSPKQTETFQRWLIGFAVANTAFAFVQRFVLNLNRLSGVNGTGGDNIKGIFLNQGAGHVVGASVAVTFAIYFCSTGKKHPLWLKLLVVACTFVHTVEADAKQVFLAFLVALLLLLITKFTNIGQAMRYLLITSVFMAALYWASETIFPALKGWIRPEIYGPNGEATLLKTAAFRILPTFYESPLNWFLGLGPGHTIGRLGGWMLKAYWDLLEPLGATKSPASAAVWQAVGESWLGNQSSMFSPLFGWAGIWGDLGLLGLAAYLYLSFTVWRELHWDDLSKFLLLTVFSFGLIFSQMEEPGYMLFVTSIVGLQWQNHYSTVRSRSHTVGNTTPAWATLANPSSNS